MWKKFEYVKVTSIDEAFKLLAQHSDDCLVFAGGSDVLVNMRTPWLKPKLLIDIKGLGELDKLSYKNQVLTIGANVTVNKLLKYRPEVKGYEIFHEAAKVFGSAQIRNRATIGGNICRASPAADMAPCMLALQAKVITATKDQSRKLKLDNFFTGPGETVLKKDEIVTAFEVPAPPNNTGTSFVKLKRTSFDIGIVSVAACLTIKDKKIDFVRIALGGVAPTTMRAVQAEKTLLGATPSQELWQDAAKIAASETKPISDRRASAEYRTHLSQVLVLKALQNALAKIGGTS